MVTVRVCSALQRARVLGERCHHKAIILANKPCCQPNTAISLHLHIWYLHRLVHQRGRRPDPKYLHGDHDTCILVPAQQRIVAILRARLCNIRSACHEILMQICAREATGDCSVHGLHDIEVSGEEDVEVTLMDLLFSLVAIPQLVKSGDLQEAL
jgi:hypothetical protein